MAKTGDGSFHGLPALVGLGDVSRHSKRQGSALAGRRNHFVERRLTACHHDDAGPMTGQAQRRGTADAGRAPRDQNHLVVKGVHKVILNSTVAIGSAADASKLGKFGSSGRSLGKFGNLCRFSG